MQDNKRMNKIDANLHVNTSIDYSINSFTTEGIAEYVEYVNYMNTTFNNVLQLSPITTETINNSLFCYKFQFGKKDSVYFERYKRMLYECLVALDQRAVIMQVNELKVSNYIQISVSK